MCAQLGLVTGGEWANGRRLPPLVPTMESKKRAGARFLNFTSANLTGTSFESLCRRSIQVWADDHPMPSSQQSGVLHHLDPSRLQ